MKYGMPRWITHTYSTTITQIASTFAAVTAGEVAEHARLLSPKSLLLAALFRVPALSTDA